MNEAIDKTNRLIRREYTKYPDTYSEVGYCPNIISRGKLEFLILRLQQQDAIEFKERLTAWAHYCQRVEPKGETPADSYN